MIAPNNLWKRFISEDEKLQFMIDHKLASPGSTYTKVLVYSGAYVQMPTPCTLEGTIGKNGIVIRIDNELHCIDVDCLAEMQSGFNSSSAPERYVVLDLETTGLSYKADRIVEIAAAKYHNGIEQEFSDHLVNPGIPIPMTVTMITGIYDFDIQNAPVLSELLPDLLAFIGDLPIVAHNAPFDRSFLQEATKAAGISFNNKWIDTLPLARKAFPSAGSYKLEDLKSYLSIPVDQSHRALPDVRATAALFEACNNALREAQARKGTDDADAMETVTKEETAALGKYRSSPKTSSIQPTVEAINPTGKLYGKNVVFTGELSISRKEAMQMAVNAGAILKSGVSKKTDYLVVGTQDITLVGVDGMSTKEETAYALNASGKAHVQIIQEDEFMKLLGRECVEV